MNIKKICLIDDNEVVFQGKLTALPIKEEVIIEKSILYFNDSEPCFIHRSAVQKLIFTILDNYFDEIIKAGHNEILWEDFNENHKNMLEFTGKTINKAIIN